MVYCIHYYRFNLDSANTGLSLVASNTDRCCICGEARRCVLSLSGSPRSLYYGTRFSSSPWQFDIGPNSLHFPLWEDQEEQEWVVSVRAMGWAQEMEWVADPELP